jgi:tetratricopeptide (TPR) repeat protein
MGKKTAFSQIGKSVGGVLLIFWIFLVGIALMPQMAWGTEEGEIFLARGNKLYLDGKYAEAKEQLLKGTEVDPQNAEIWSLLGTTYLALKDYSQAKNAFAKAVDLDPTVPRGKLYLGVANYYLDNISEAQRWINEANKLAPEDGLVHYYAGLVAARQERPKEALTELETGMHLAPQFALGFKAYQEAVKVYREEKPFYIAFTTGIEYDDNVKVLPDRTTVSQVVAGQPVGQYKGHKADWRTPLILNAAYEPLRTEKWSGGVRYYGYGGLNYYLDNFNICDQLGEVYLKYRWDRLTINPFFAFDYTWLGGQPFSQFISPGLRLTLAETANLTGDLIYMYQNRQFKTNIGDPYYDRTGDMNQVGFFQTLAGKPGAIRAGFIYEREVTKGRNFTGNHYRLPVEGFLNLPWRITAYGYFEWAKTACDYKDSFAHRIRNEDYFQVIVQLRRPVTSWMNVIVGYNHISNPSNIKDYQYDRNIYQLLAMFYY